MTHKSLYTLSILAFLCTNANAIDFKPLPTSPDGSNAANEISSYTRTVNPGCHPILQLPAKTASSDNTVIFEAPEGEVVHYSTSGSAYMAIAGMVGEIPVENFDTEMVYADNNEVYWKNCITQAVPNSYIKGIDKGDFIEFQLPQCIMSYPDAEGNQINIYVHRMKYTIVNDATGEGWFYVDEDNDTVTLTKNDDGSLSGDVVKGEAIIGMTTPEGEWYGYGNYDIVMTPGIETPVEVPSDLETEQWVMISDGVGKFIRVGFDGDDIYLTALYDFMPEVWVKGHVEEGKATFPNQFVGILEMLQCSTYFRAITLEYDEEYGDYMPVMNENGMTFAYDAERKELVCTDNDTYLSLMGGPGYLFEYYLTPTLRWQPEKFEINLPNPVIIDCFNYDDRINYGVVAFNLPALTKEGYALDPANISYRMFVDGDPFTFSPDEYSDLDEDMEWLPFTMDNFDIHTDGSYHQIDHYLFDADTYAIQARYKDAETEYLTDIVSATVTGVPALDADKEITSEKTVTLDGRAVANPTKGIYIKTVTYSDGTARTIKELVK